MYRALYRKWRPQRFSDVVGQEDITAALSNQILADKIGHAYLFTGTRGTGKTTCAKILAQAVNCESRTGADPCGECPCCVGLENGSILDVIEIDAASNNSVDDVRDLRDETVYRPSRCRFRVYIIDEVHMLSTQAFNALLKILEEPPSHVIFILATTEIHKVPATILSRCQRFDFGRIPARKMADRLLLIAKEEHIELSDAAAELIAQIAGGSLRDAISLLDTCSGLGQAVDETLVRRMAGVADRHYLFAISHAVARGDVTELLVQLNALRETSLDMRRLCEELIAHYRNFLLAAADPSGALIQGMAAEDVQEYTKNSTETPGNAAIVAMKRLAAALERMARSPDPRIDLELALFELCEGPKGQERERNAPKSKEKKEIKAQKLPESKTVESPAPEGPAALDPGAQDVESDAAMPASPKPEAPVRPEQESAAEAIPDVPVPLPLWPQVLEQLSNTDKMLYSYMKDSTAYTDGRRVLIDGGDIFLTFMQDNDQARERIKTVIQLATGRRYGIGPYKAPAQDAGAAPKSGMDTLREWEAKGVEVQYGKTDVEA